MPFKSENQRRFLWARHPEIARRWSKKYGNSVESIKRKLNDRRSNRTRNSD